MRFDVDGLIVPGGELVQQHAVGVVREPSRSPLGVVDAGRLDEGAGHGHEAPMPGRDGVGIGQRQHEACTRDVRLLCHEDREVRGQALGERIGRRGRSDGTNWYTSFRSALGPREVDVEDALEEARARSGEILPAPRRVLDEADPTTTLAQRITVAPRLRSYVRGRTVLVGDAAHAMTPNLGRGGCEALVDADTLARLLETRPVAEALERYDAERVRPTQRLAATSAFLSRVALAERAQPVRDAVVATVGRVSGRRRTASPTEPARAIR